MNHIRRLYDTKPKLSEIDLPHNQISIQHGNRSSKEENEIGWQSTHYEFMQFVCQFMSQNCKAHVCYALFRTYLYS